VRSKIKKHNWGWIVAVVIIVAILLIPSAELQEFVEDADHKFTILQKLILTITDTTKAATSFVVAVLALIFYKVTKNR